MKFTDGYWQLRPGVSVLRPAGVESVEQGDRSVTVFAPTGQITGRGDTLNRPVVTAEFFSPAPGVIGVTIGHFSGGLPKQPTFKLADDLDHPIKIETATDADGQDVSVSLTSGDLTARVQIGDRWRVDFVRADGSVVTSSLPRSIGIVTDAEGRRFIHERLLLDVGETVYGLGERFGSFVKNGQTVDIWNADGGTASEQAYKNVPFYLSSAGYGVFVDHPEHVSFEVGSEVVSQSQFSVEGQSLTYYLIDGPTPKDVLSRYTALTGRPAEVPGWSFGLWLSTSFTTSYDEATVTEFIEGMAERDLPLSVFHFDCFWMRQFHWCDFVWDPATFPDPAGMLARLHERGLKVCVWINPYIAQRSYLFRGGTPGRVPGEEPGRVGLAVGQVAGRDGPGRFHQPRTRPPGTPRSSRSCWTWASTASRPTSASGSRPMWSGTTVPTRSGCTTTTPTSTTSASSTCWRPSAGPARPWCSPARPRPVASSTRCTGWRLRVHLRRHGRVVARRAVPGRLRLRLLEP